MRDSCATILAETMLGLWMLAGNVGAQEALTREQVLAPERKQGPLLACTPLELGRLRKAYGEGEKVVLQRVQQARKRLSAELVFPPRGGQHNQWYQCESCQIGLQTLSDTKHRCPKCKKVYRGAPFDDVIFSRVHAHNWRRALDASWAHALTGRAEFLADAKKIVLGYAKRYERYPYHTNSKGGTRKVSGGGHIKEQSLSEASLMIDSIVPACDLIWSSMSPAERKQVGEHLIRPMLANLERAPRGKSNWQSFHNAAMFAGGALIGEARWMRRSIFHKTNGFLFQMKRCVSAEGMWFENSWGYHLYTLRALTAHAEYARRVSIDLWHQGPLQLMVELPIAYTMPDGSLPRFGDDVNSRVSYRTGFIQAARPIFESPLLDRMSQGPASWQSILHGNKIGSILPMDQGGSRLFPGAGHAILRSPGKKGLCSVTTFGSFGGFHGHFDKLSFVLFAYGNEFGVDPGRARSQAYRLPVHKLWYRGTIAHNAVVVDGKSQRGTSGKLLLFQKTPGYQAVAVSVDQAYRKMHHARCLIQTDEFLLILDTLRSSAGERRFDWVYHNRSASVQCRQAPHKTKATLDRDGGRFVELISTGQTSEAILAHFEGPQRGLFLHVPSTRTRTRIFTGTGVGRSVLDRIPLVILSRTGRKASFASLLEPVEAKAPSQVLEFAAHEDKGVWRVVVRTQNKRLELRWDGANSLELDGQAAPGNRGKKR